MLKVRGLKMTNLKEYPYAASVYIGRFQPFHNGHLNSIISALQKSHRLILVLGGAYLSPSIRGPWSVEERIQMIQSCLTKQQLNRIDFIYVRDRLYCEQLWIQNVKGEVAKLIDSHLPIAIIGHEKDSSSYYLKVFPQWVFLETGNFKGINATDIRKSYFLSENLKSAYDKMPKPISNWLKNYRKKMAFKIIKEKYIYIQKMKLNKKLNLNSEVSNVFILRKNLFSMPEIEDFNQFDPQNSILNEIIFKNFNNKLNFKLLNQRIFDYSDRYPIGMQKSNTFYFQLNHENLPTVLPGKNSEHVEWTLLDDIHLLENQIYADHFQIMKWFLNFTSS
jgi:bifunctional NMN adenylyltransferase/nudix hydrolase